MLTEAAGVVNARSKRFPPTGRAAKGRGVSSAVQRRSRRRLLELAGICLLAAVLGAFLFPRIPYLALIESTARDRLIELSAKRDLGREFAFIAIDEASLRPDDLWPEDLEASPALASMANGFPWPRSVYAAAIDRILAAGARVVIVDLIFDRPREGDAELRAAMERHPRQVVLASNYSEDEGDPLNPDDNVPALTMPTTALLDDPTHDARVGYANFWPGPDDVVRRAIYATTLSERAGRPSAANETVYRSLAAATLGLMGGPDVTRDRRPQAFFFARPGSVPTYSFRALFVPHEWRQELRDGQVLKDRIVIIGPLASRLQDFHLTPVGRIAGPLLHVHALSAAMHGDFYRPIGTSGTVATLGLAALAALGITWSCRKRPVLALGLVLAGVAGYSAAVLLGLQTFHVLLPAIVPIAIFGAAGVGGMAWNFACDRQESGRMRSMLERYISRNLVREVLDNREDFLSALGGTRRPVTVFFSDVRGFTSVSEREDAGQVVEQLNEYLGEMVAVIFHHQGTVDKFMGDGIMAVWGNVVSESPSIDARQAVRAALEMQRRIDALNASWRERSMTPFHVGMGLHHGEAVFGNIGSAEKMEPTVIGDTVNLASRIEGLTKKYGVSLLISQSVAELLGDEFRLRSVDLVRVVGKSRPTEVLTVLGPHGIDVPDWIKLYEGGLADYRARRFAEAREQFLAAMAQGPEDRLCGLYLERTERFLAEPPPAEWDGVDIASSK